MGPRVGGRSGFIAIDHFLGNTILFRVFHIKVSPERAVALGGPVLRSISRTLRWYYVGWEEIAHEAVSQGVIISFWHNRILGSGLIPVFQRFRTVTLISDHRDGEIITRLAGLFGHTAARGSTGAGKGGLRGLLTLAREAGPGRLLGITPDGPRGPRYRVQPGVAILAKRTGLRVVPYVPAYSARWRAASWDRFEVPLPFARAHAFFGSPIAVGPDEDVAAAAARIEAAMHAATTAAEAFFGRTPDPPGDEPLPGDAIEGDA